MKNSDYLNDRQEGLKTQRLKHIIKNSLSSGEFNIDIRRKPSSKNRNNKSCSSRNIQILNENNAGREVTSKLKQNAKGIFSKLPSKQSEKLKDLK